MLIMLRVTMITVKMRKIEWTRGMWADCGNVNSPVSLRLFEGENKSKFFQKSLTALYVNRDDEEDIGSQDTMDINVIILMFPNPTFSGNMVTSKATANV